MAAQYAQVSDVVSRIGSRPVTATSKPSLNDVQGWLDEGEAMLNGALQAAGLPAPYTDDASKLILRGWLCEYALGLLDRSQAFGRGDVSTGGSDLVNKFYGRLDAIQRDPSSFGAMLAAGHAPASSSRLRAFNRDGAIAPEFERGKVWH